MERLIIKDAGILLKTDDFKRQSTVDFLKMVVSSPLEWEQTVPPLVAVRNSDEKLLVLDGNHRRDVAESHNLPVTVNVLETDLELTTFQKNAGSVYKFRSLSQARDHLHLRNKRIE